MPPDADEQKRLDAPERRQRLRELARDLGHDGSWLEDWPKPALTESLRRRQPSLATLDGTDAAAVPAVVNRFLAASKDGRSFLLHLKDLLLLEVETGDPEWLDPAHRLLTAGGTLCIDVCRGEFVRDVAHPGHVSGISRALSQAGTDGAIRPLCAHGRYRPSANRRHFRSRIFDFSEKRTYLPRTTIFLLQVDTAITAPTHFRSARGLSNGLGEALRELTAEHRAM